MALLRCHDYGVRPVGQGKYTRNYVRHVLPVGHPNSAVICCKPTCMNALAGEMATNLSLSYIGQLHCKSL
jgi:hypothetical protein